MEQYKTRDCNLCEEILPFTAYYKSDTSKGGIRYRCKKCICKVTRERREDDTGFREKDKLKCKKWASTEKGRLYLKEKNRNARYKDPEKWRARTQLKQKVYHTKGFKRHSCEICHDGPTEGHHEDYTKPLDVVWLCSRCHHVLHRQYKKQGVVIKY